jgi:hypothetical protein
MLTDGPMLRPMAKVTIDYVTNTDPDNVDQYGIDQISDLETSYIYITEIGLRNVPDKYWWYSTNFWEYSTFYGTFSVPTTSNPDMPFPFANADGYYERSLVGWWNLYSQVKFTAPQTVQFSVELSEGRSRRIYYTGMPGQPFSFDKYALDRNIQAHYNVSTQTISGMSTGTTDHPNLIFFDQPPYNGNAGNISNALGTLNYSDLQLWKYIYGFDPDDTFLGAIEEWYGEAGKINIFMDAAAYIRLEDTENVTVTSQAELLPYAHWTLAEQNMSFYIPEHILQSAQSDDATQLYVKAVKINPLSDGINILSAFGDDVQEFWRDMWAALENTIEKPLAEMTYGDAMRVPQFFFDHDPDNALRLIFDIDAVSQQERDTFLDKLVNELDGRYGYELATITLPNNGGTRTIVRHYWQVDYRIEIDVAVETDDTIIIAEENIKERIDKAMEDPVNNVREFTLPISDGDNINDFSIYRNTEYKFSVHMVSTDSWDNDEIVEESSLNNQSPNVRSARSRSDGVVLRRR